MYAAIMIPVHKMNEERACCPFKKLCVCVCFICFHVLYDVAAS